MNYRLAAFVDHFMKSKHSDFYDYVARYYDKDIELGFESWAEENPILEKIRNDFRQITIRYPFKNALEIGCGPGFDVTWLAREFPDKEITGIDISPRMVEQAKKRINSMNLSNAKVMVSDERDLPKQFKSEAFDLIYVYFGALNTVADLDFAAKQIKNLLKPGGHAVLTFVNKWYLREMIVQALKMNFKTAFARLREDWGGYSPARHLPSKCYSSKQIRKAFADFSLLEKKGYSILFPAWYNFNKFLNQKEKAEKLWKTDQKLQNTQLWSKGEYTLFVFRK
ncbi:MAG: class I SAM-dependent methyltransferase [Bacteroidales bacterium]|nr:class I SAM-dependent methyltransferase [Bacteroidales bacterium]